jgi:hypothetical protein
MTDNAKQTPSSGKDDPEMTPSDGTNSSLKALDRTPRITRWLEECHRLITAKQGRG